MSGNLSELIRGDPSPMLPQSSAPAPHGWRVLAVLATLMGFASISTDIYLPAMPAMGRSLAALPGSVEWTVSGYLLGFSAGQLLWGPIGDRFGRKGPIAIGIILFAIGSAGCALAGDIWTVIAFRVVQAVGASAGVVMGRAMVRDLYSGSRASEMMAILMTVMAIAPLVGPIAGSQVLLLAGWRAVFWLLVAIGAIALAATATLPETLPALRRDRDALRAALPRYAELLGDRQLLAYIGTGAAFYAGMFAYIAGSPFALIDYHHLTPYQYSLAFGAGIVGVMGSSLLNARLVGRFGAARMLRTGAALAAVSGIAMAVVASGDWGGIAGLFVPLMFFIGSTGFIVANSVSGALADHEHRAGAVSSLVGAIQYGSGILGSLLVGLLADGTAAPLGWVIGASGCAALLCAQALPRSLARS